MSNVNVKCHQNVDKEKTKKVAQASNRIPSIQKQITQSFITFTKFFEFKEFFENTPETKFGFADLLIQFVTI
jgi:hypothetical protein